MTAGTLPHPQGLRRRRLLAYAGVLPFAGGLLVMLLADDRGWQAYAASGLLEYAALIACFLGAVHWGVANADRGVPALRLAWGVSPALLAWALLKLPPELAFAGFAILFAVILLVDYCLLPLLDDDYRRLRLRLSVLVIATLITAAVTAPGNSA